MGRSGSARYSTASVLARRAVYTIILCSAILFLLSRATTYFERRGWINLDTPDSSITYLPDRPYIRDGDQYVTNPIVRDAMVPVRFRSHKGDAWRMFVLGESFAMGTPYVVQSDERPGEGGMTSWLAADLRALFPSVAIEIINAAAGAQNSFRVRRVAEEIVQLEPDAILIAMCNNEGVLPPGRVDELLHRNGAYRLLTKLAVPDVAPQARSYFSPQDPDVEAIRAAFETNLRAILEAAYAHRISVLLCTMPVNLRYESDGAGQLFRETDGRYAEPQPSDCTRRATEYLIGGDPGGALELLQECEMDLEGLRTRGLALFALERDQEARAVLNAYTELAPRNRCRPSLNHVIREQARAHPWVHLVDLEAAAEAISPGGIPGRELFFDYCHMNWGGYAAMAEAIRKVMQDNGVGPPGVWDAERLPSRAAVARQLGLPDIPNQRPD